VQDFLKGSEAVQSRLDNYAGQAIFDAHFSLLACYVFLIKRALKFRGDYLSGIREIATNWCAEALFHMRELPARPSTTNLLYALDHGMQMLYNSLGSFHWANYLVEDPLSYRKDNPLHDLDVFERGNRDLLGHLIETGLISYVEALLKSNPRLLQAKKGRPYLDYALRYKINAPFRSTLFRHPRADGADAMVTLLLNLGCDVNEVVYSHGNRTVWDSYLYYLYDHNMKDDLDRKIAWLLINNGAAQTGDRVVSPPDQRGRLDTEHDNVYEMKPAGWMESTPMGRMVKALPGFKWTSYMLRSAMRNHYVEPVGPERMRSMEAMLAELFGEDEAKAMQQYISKNGRESSWPPNFLMSVTWHSSAGKATQFVWDDPSIISLKHRI
jgi:hypothetical protein